MIEERLLGSLKAQKIHFILGLIFSSFLIFLIGINAFNYWLWQANIIDALLNFAGVPHNLFFFTNLNQQDYFATGPTFEIPVDNKLISPSLIIITIIFFLSIIVITNFSKRLNPPFKAALSIIAFLTIMVLIWNTFISPIPAYTIHWITIDWSCSGIISFLLVSIIFIPFLFTINGPLRIKFSWFIITIGFSIVWNLIRLSFVTATLYHLGGMAFLISHYLIGAFIDFIYIITFYSLALSQLSKNNMKIKGDHID